MRKTPDAVVSRFLAALLGGYVVSNLVAIALAAMLPLSPVDGVIAGMSAGFAVYAALAIWVFSAGTVKRAWAGMLVLAGVVFCILVVHYLWVRALS